MDWPPNLLSVSDLTCIALTELLDLAERMKADVTAFSDALEGQTVACFFDPPTTGATLSAAVAADRLGMLPLMLPRRELEVGSGEPLGDIARTFSVAAAALLTHAVPHRTLRRIAAHATVPVVNALSDEHRPCQALADLLTLREHYGSLAGLEVAFLGDAGTGIAHSLMEAAALAEMEIRVACPPQYRPSRLVQAGAEIIAERHGGRVTIMDDPRRAVAGAHAVYTAPWVPVGRECERGVHRERLRRFHIHPELMTLAHRDHVFMHCLPARRGEEASAMVVDGGHSVVWEQAANRVHAEEAVVFALVTARAQTPAEKLSHASGSPAL
jgi:ornithine carbamoyltransferase